MEDYLRTSYLVEFFIQKQNQLSYKIKELTLIYIDLHIWLNVSSSHSIGFITNLNQSTITDLLSTSSLIKFFIKKLSKKIKEPTLLYFNLQLLLNASSTNNYLSQSRNQLQSTKSTNHLQNVSLTLINKPNQTNH